MARPHGGRWDRWQDERRWTEGEDIRSEPGGARDREDAEPYAGTRDMDFGGAYGGGRDRERGSRHMGPPRDIGDPWSGSPWDHERPASRDRGWMGAGREHEWRGREAGREERWRGSEDRDDWSGHEQGPGGGYEGGWGGTGGYGSSSGGYGATGLTGSHGPWGRGGAGYSGSGGRTTMYRREEEPWSGGGRHGSGEYGAFRQADERGADWQAQQRYRGPSEHPRPHEHGDRGLVDKVGDTLRRGVAKLTGRGPKGYRRSDDRIREEVCERIVHSGIDAGDVEVQVESGEVTLRGEVSTRMDKWRLEEAVDDVYGVDDVHNHLRTRRATPRSTTESAEARDEDRGAGLPH